MTGKFELYRDKAGSYRYRLKAGNGQVVLTGEGYSSKTACMDGIESVRKNAQKETAFALYVDKKGEHRFRLKAPNGEIIGHGEGYSSKSGCMKGVTSIMKNAPSSKVVEL